MSNIETYSDPIIRKLMELVSAAMPGTFSVMYQGDPIRLLSSDLPALIISKSMTRIGPHNNDQDEHEISMTMTIVTDIREELGGPEELVPGVSQLYELIEARNSSDYSLQSNCLLHILRSNRELDTAKNLRIDLGSITRSDYRLTLNKRAVESYAVEGEVQFIVNFIQSHS